MTPSARSHRVLDALFLVTLFLVPLILFPFGSDMYEIPKNLFFKGMVCLAVLIAAVTAFLKGTVTWKIPKGVLKAISVLLLILTISLIFSERPWISFWGSYFRQGGTLNFLFYIAFFLWGISFFSRKTNLKPFLWTVLSSGILVAIYSALQRFGLDFFPPEMTDVFAGRSFSTLGNPTSLGAYLLFPLGAALGLFGKYKARRTKAFLSAAALLVLASIFFSETRGAELAILGVVGLFFMRWMARKPKLLLLSLVALIVAVGAFTYLNLDNTRSLSSRLVIWESTVPLIMEKPIFGYGLENFDYAIERTMLSEFFQYEDFTNLVDRPHNEILEMWVHLGLLGLIGYLCLFVWVLKCFWTAKDSTTRWIAGTVLALFFANFFGFSLVTHCVLLTAVLSALVHPTKLVTFRIPSFLSFIGALLAFAGLVWQLFFFKGDWELAKVLNAEAEGDLPSAELHLMSALRILPMYGETYQTAYAHYFVWATTLSNDELLFKAADMVELSKNYLGESLKNRLNEARLYETAGALDAADLVYSAAVQELAPNPVLYRNLGEFYFRQERYDEAVLAFWALLELLPPSWQAPIMSDGVMTDEERIFWKNHPEFLTTLDHLRTSYEKLGLSEEVRALELLLN